MQDEDRSLIGVEASEAALELVATGHIEANLHPPRNFRHPDRVDLDLDRTPPSLTPCLAITGVDDQKETSASWAASSARASSRRINRATTNR